MYYVKVLQQQHFGQELYIEQKYNKNSNISIILILETN